MAAFLQGMSANT